MKQSKWLNGDLKPEHKKTTNITTLAGSRYLVWWLTHHRVIKQGSKIINHNWVQNYACSLTQNIHVVTIFVVSVSIVPKNQFCQQSFWIYRLSRHKI